MGDYQAAGQHAQVPPKPSAAMHGLPVTLNPIQDIVGHDP